MPPEVHSTFKDILLGGAFAPKGMESFEDILNDKDVENIHAYLIEQSWQAYRQQKASDAADLPKAGSKVNNVDPR